MPGPAFRHFSPLPNNPSVEYAAGPDGHGRYWISCRCRVCGPQGDFAKPCSLPMRTMLVVQHYAKMHVH